MSAVADPVARIRLVRPASHGRRGANQALDVGWEAGECAGSQAQVAFQAHQLFVSLADKDKWREPLSSRDCASCYHDPFIGYVKRPFACLDACGCVGWPRLPPDSSIQ